MSPNKRDVLTWLRNNKAEEYATAFEKAGYTDVADVDEDAIKKIVTDKEGLQKHLINSLKTKAWDTPAIPTLPAKTVLDISAPTLTSPEGVEFAIPEHLAITPGGSPVKTARDLDRGTEWPVLAKHCNMLYGFRMDTVGTELVMAEKPALFWRVPDDWDFVQCLHLKSEVKTNITYSERSNNRVKAGFRKEDASAAYMFASASFEHSVSEKQTSLSRSKDLFMTGMYRYPRARLFLHACTAVSTKFEAAVREALGRGEKAYQALEAVFADYGHVVPWEIELGGQLLFEHHRRETATFEESKAEVSWQAAVALKFGNLSGGGSFEKTDNSVESKELKAIVDQTLGVAIGGDTTLNGNPSAFADSVKDPARWAVIAINKMLPTVELLNDELKAKVKALWAQHNHGAEPRPEMDGRVYTMAAVANPVNPEKKVLAGPWGSAPFKLPLLNKKEQHKWLVSFVAPIAKNAKTYCEDRVRREVYDAANNPGRTCIDNADGKAPFLFPTQGFSGVSLVDSRVLANDADTGTRWRLTFSGHRDRDHGSHPLFWIEHVKTGWLLAWDIVSKGLDFFPPLLLVESSAKADPMGTGIGALWAIEPAKAALGEDYEDASFLIHFSSHRKLRVVGFQRFDAGDDDRMKGGGPCLYAAPAQENEHTLLGCAWRLVER
jgi:hypothetical protein